MGPRIKREVPIPLADVRLVVPYEIIRRGVPVYEDVVVENILMERHTTGIDPFTGKDYGDAAIPEEHQYDPDTGLPIFHRYIAGTDQRIEWPWEQEKEEDTQGIGASSNTSDSKESLTKRLFNTLRHPIRTLKGSKSESKQGATGVIEEGEGSSSKLKDSAYELERLEQEEEERMRKKTPRSQDPKLRSAFGEDTTRNIVEGAPSMAYSLLVPPYPETLDEELRGHNKMVKDSQKGTRKEIEIPQATKTKKTGTGQSPILNAISEQKNLANQRMKTPSQLHWELEQAKKLRKEKQEPLVKTDALLAALGQRMQKNLAKA